MQPDSEQLLYLPALKSTIELSYAGIDFWQDKVWILKDKITDKYYYLGKVEYEIINNWSLGTNDAIIQAVNADTIYNINQDTINQVFKFLLNNNLLQLSNQTLRSLEKNRKKPLLLLLGYLGKIFSYRIPLFNPDKFLSYTKDKVKFVFSEKMAFAIICIFFIDLYLLANQWGNFTASIPSLNNLTNIILIAFTAVFTKVIHEFGHAYASKMYDCKVPEMGVNLIFFYPIFYTDVSQTILLSPEKRLVVSTAGIRLEIYLAIIAGFFWLLLPDDTIFKNLLFFIAAVSWVVSLAINVMPFMRFDGYYILSDYLRIRNLGPRSFAVLKYYYRTIILGIDSVLPESYDSKKFQFFTIFAVLSGIYRLLLYFSIISFLYYIEFIGGFLFAISILLLITVPISKEIYNLYLFRQKIQMNTNLIITASVFGLVFLLAWMPFTSYVYLPAVFYGKTQRLYTPFISRVDKIDTQLEQDVIVNQELLLLTSLELEEKKIINQLNYDTKKYEALGEQLSDKEHKFTESKLAEVEQQKVIAENIAAKNKQLQILSPIVGKVTAISPGLNPGLWLAENTWLLDVTNQDSLAVQAFIRSQDLSRLPDLNRKNDKLLNKNLKAIFIPDQLDSAVCRLQFKSIASDPIGKISNEPFVALEVAQSKLVNSNILLFASNYGGDINFNIDEDSNWVSVDSYFTIDLSADKNCNYNNKIAKGIIKVQTYNTSLMWAIYNKLNRTFFRN